jgi:hypothetical protein
MAVVEREVEDLADVATVRLVTAGVPRPNRVRAMRMLAILSAVADDDFVVRTPVLEVAAQFDFPVDEARGAIDALEQVGVLHHYGPGVRLTARATTGGGIQLAELVEEPDRRGFLARTMPVRPVLSAVLAALFLLVSAAAGSRLVEGAKAKGEGTPPDGAATTDKLFPQGRIPGGKPAVDVPDNAALPVPVAPVTTLVLATCPAGAPVITVVGSTPDADGLLSVEGTAMNPLPAAVHITAATVYVSPAGQPASMLPFEQQLSVPPHGQVHWQIRTAITGMASTPATVVLDHWGWADDVLAARCAAS